MTSPLDAAKAALSGMTTGGGATQPPSTATTQTIPAVPANPPPRRISTAPVSPPSGGHGATASVPPPPSPSSPRVAPAAGLFGTPRTTPRNWSGVRMVKRPGLWYGDKKDAVLQARRTKSAGWRAGVAGVVAGLFVLFGAVLLANLFWHPTLRQFVEFPSEPRQLAAYPLLWTHLQLLVIALFLTAFIGVWVHHLTKRVAQSNPFIKWRWLIWLAVLIFCFILWPKIVPLNWVDAYWWLAVFAGFWVVYRVGRWAAKSQVLANPPGKRAIVVRVLVGIFLAGLAFGIPFGDVIKLDSRPLYGVQGLAAGPSANLPPGFNTAGLCGNKNVEACKQDINALFELSRNSLATLNAQCERSDNESSCKKTVEQQRANYQAVRKSYCAFFAGKTVSSMTKADTKECFINSLVAGE